MCSFLPYAVAERVGNQFCFPERAHQEDQASPGLDDDNDEYSEVCVGGEPTVPKLPLRRSFGAKHRLTFTLVVVRPVL